MSSNNHEIYNTIQSYCPDGITRNSPLPDLIPPSLKSKLETLNLLSPLKDSYFFLRIYFQPPHIRALKERAHSEMKTCDRWDYCRHIQPITLIFIKCDPTFLNSVSVSKICTPGDLHRTIWGPASHHPWTCIRVFEDPHQNIWTCMPQSRDLYHTIRTCIILPYPLRLAKEIGQKKIKTIIIISKVNLIIDEIFI